MDHHEPLRRPPESEPIFTPAVSEKKAGWRLFDLFKSKETVEPEATASVKPEAKPGEKPPEAAPRRFGEALIKLLTGEVKSPSEATPKLEQATDTPAPQPEKAPTLVGRARDMGRNVLNLLKGVRQEVQEADTREDVVEPTSIEPLEQADEQVRAAMEELVEPINEHVARQATSLSAETLPVAADGGVQPEAPLPALSASSNFDASGSQPAPEYTAAPSRLLQAAEMAVAIAATAAERIERPRPKAILRKLGVLALGGAFVYTWHRQRKIKKDQRAQRRQLKRFEAEVREEQKYASERIQALERAQVEALNQPKREAYVREVSRFALGQAEEIRSVATFARAQERPVVANVETRLAGPAPLRIPAPEVTHPPFRPLETQAQPTLFKTQEFTTPERPPLLPRKPAEAESLPRRVLDRLTGSVASQARQSGTTAGAAGASNGLANRLFGMLPGGAQKTEPNNQPGSQQKPVLPLQPAKSTQAWLLGVALAAGIGLILLIAMGVL